MSFLSLKVGEPHTTNGAEKRTLGSRDELVQEIARLPQDWHLAGVMTEEVLRAIARYAARMEISASLETGSGKTTLLFSHLSREHKVFAVDDGNRSITAVRESPLLNRATVEFIDGPTQLTLPRYAFTGKLQMALIDGPHGYPFPEMEYYYIYPLLDVGAVLIVDDIHIPTIRRLYEFLCEEEMFQLLEVVGNSAFFRRTSATMFSPLGDGWWEQKFNIKRFPVGVTRTTFSKAKGWVGKRLPGTLKERIERISG